MTLCPNCGKNRLYRICIKYWLCRNCGYKGPIEGKKAIQRAIRKMKKRENTLKRLNKMGGKK